MSSIDNNAAADFLLGRLSDEQRDAVEEGFVTNQQSFEQLLQAENDLIDDYVAGRLSSEDRRRFESIVLKRQKERVHFARAMSAYLAANTRTPARVAAGPGWRARLGQIFTVPPMYAAGLSAAALAVALGAVFLLTRPPERELATVEAPQEQAATVLPSAAAPSADSSVTLQPSGAVPAVDDTPAAKETLKKTTAADVRPRASQAPAVIATVMLIPGLTRGGSSATAIELPNRNGLISLQLPREQASFSHYTILVETVDGQQIWNQRVSAKAGNIRTSVPRKRLQRGDYIVTLKGISPDGLSETLNEYTFAVKN